MTRAVWLAFGLLFAATNLRAQSDEPAFRDFDFNFITPGARQLALGGAFIALADDATAAVSNPAGLTQLFFREFAFEYKVISYQSFQLSGIDGPILQSPPFVGEFLLPPGTVGETTTFYDSVNVPSFFSFSYPFKKGTLAFYSHQLADYQSKFRTGAFTKGTNGELLQFPGVESKLKFAVEDYGATGSWSVTDRFSIGASLRFSRLRTELETQFGSFRSVINDSSWRASVTLGALYSVPLGETTMSFGGVYANGPKMTVREESGSRDLPLTIDIPDRFGLGVSLRTRSHWAFAVDVVRVAYRDLSDSFTAVIDPQSQGKIVRPNVTELHLGTEYTLFIRNNSRLYLRAGGFADPAHGQVYEGPLLNEQQIYNSLTFVPEELVWHATVGIGFAMGNAWQLDIGGDFGRKSDAGSISFVYRFGSPP